MTLHLACKRLLSRAKMQSRFHVSDNQLPPQSAANLESGRQAVAASLVRTEVAAPTVVLSLVKHTSKRGCQRQVTAKWKQRRISTRHLCQRLTWQVQCLGAMVAAGAPDPGPSGAAMSCASPRPLGASSHACGRSGPATSSARTYAHRQRLRSCVIHTLSEPCHSMCLGQYNGSLYLATMTMTMQQLSTFANKMTVMHAGVQEVFDLLMGRVLTRSSSI